MKDLHQGNERSEQQVYMVGHHDKGVRLELTQIVGVIADGVDYNTGDLRLSQPVGAGHRLVQNGVGYFERCIGRDDAGGEASLQAEGDEGRVVEEMNVGEVAAVESHGYLLVGSRRDYSHLFFRWLPTGQGARPTRRGVTLLEMLVVVGIVSILMGVSYPSIAASVDSVRLATAADSTAAFLNSALNRAEQRHQVLELTISKRQNQLILRSGDPSFLRKLELPTGVRIAEILPTADEEARVFYLIPGGAAPRVGVQLVNARGAKRTVRVDPITGAPEIER